MTFDDQLYFWIHMLDEAMNKTYFDEEEGIADNEIYLLNMSKSFGDKAWFLKKMSPSIEMIVDFGGGEGQFCEYIEKMIKRPMKFVIIDNNPEFASNAKTKGYQVFESLQDFRQNCDYDPEKTLLNMSSVIHEVYSYADPFYDDVGVFWVDIKKCRFKQIAIRDMSVNDSDYRNIPIDAICWIYDNVFKSDLAQVGNSGMKKPLRELLESFEDIWGKICDVDRKKVNVKNLIHFLIKYRYIENWDREVQENYLPVTQNKLEKILRQMGYSLTHKESSKLEFYSKTWDKDFKLNRPDNNRYRKQFSDWLKTLNTHIKWMAEKQ